LKRSAMVASGVTHRSPLTGRTSCSLSRGVEKEKVKSSARRAPSSAVRPPGTVTVKVVESGTGPRGTNSAEAEPNHRHAPSSAGSMRAKGWTSSLARCASTISRLFTGREKVMVGRASPTASPRGRAATTMRASPEPESD